MRITLFGGESRNASSTVGLLKLTRFDTFFVPIILCKYNHYVRRVTNRAHQIVCKDILRTKATKPYQISYCVDSEGLELLIDLAPIYDVSSYEDISTYQLKNCLTMKVEESKSVLTFDTL